MAIHAQMNTNQVGLDGSEFALINNNGVNGIRNDQSYMNQNNNIQTQKDLYQQALFHHQQNRPQSFLPAQMEKQKQEIYELIRIQNERLRYVVQAQMRQENEMILRKMEGKALFLMNQKEEEMSKALSKNLELEDLMRKLEMENQTWQRIARENETMVQRLNSTLEQVRERAAAVEDEGSSWGGEGDGGGVVAQNKISGCCCNCGSNGVTRVLFLPCRHLCCCTDCEVGLVLCPICNTPKKNRIEAFF